MERATSEEYRALYGESLTEAEMDRLGWEARRVMDNVTTGVDGVHKLTEAAPTEEHAAQAVRRCELVLVRLLRQMEMSQGTVEREDGTVRGRVVTAVTAGAESVSFAAPVGQASGGEERRRLLRQTAEEYLSGVADANGVPLLFAGTYPVRLKEA